MKPSLPTMNGTTARLVAGWSWLLFHLVAFTPVGKVAAALFGAIDPVNHVLAQRGTNGMPLVLHHKGNCSGQRQPVAARVSNLLAQPASATDPDHVLHGQFAVGDGLWSGSEPVVCGGDSCEPPQFVRAESSASVARSPAYSPPPPNPPPDAGGPSLNVRSTILLI